MTDPIKVYAVVSGEYSDYQVHAIYRQRKDAEARVRNLNEISTYHDMLVEEFDYYEGEPTPVDVRDQG